MRIGRMPDRVRYTAAFFFLAVLAPVSIAQIDSIEYSIGVGGEVGIIEGPDEIIEYAGESICLTAVGGMTPPDFPFQFDVMLGFGEMYVGRNLWYDNLSPHNFFLLSRVGASTYFVNGSRIYAALTLVKPLKSEVLFTEWGKHSVASYTTGTILHALCHEFGLRVRIAMFQLELRYRATFNYSITSWSNLKWRFSGWAMGIAYVLDY